MLTDLKPINSNFIMKNHINLFLILGIFALSALFSCTSKDIYVSFSGNDTNSGTMEKPFATIKKAKIEARKINKSVNIILREGTYYLTEKKMITSQDSRSKNAPLVIKSYPGEKVVISGAIHLKLNWEVYKDGIWMAKVNEDFLFDQLYVNGKAQRMARYPNYDATARIFGGTSADAISPERVAKWQSPAGGIVHTIHPSEWGSYHYIIKGKDNKNILTLERKIHNEDRKFTSLTAPMHPKSRFVENIFEELDTVNEWYYNKNIRTIYFYPPEGVNLANTSIEIPQIESLIEFKGSEEAPVENIKIEGLTFSHTLRTFMNTSERMSRGDWYIYRCGTVFMEGTQNCKIENCTFTELGGNAVFVNSYNRDVEVTGCLFKNIGASALCFCGNADAQYSLRAPLEERALHIGPKTNNYPANCTVYDNLMFNLGTIEKQVAGVHISMARCITVSHNTIYDVPRAGINVNDGMWGGHIIEFNDVFNTVLETADHGAFNSWGRDHDYFRAGDTLALTQRDKIAGLDVLSPIIIRNNRFRCDHGWDIDLDDGSQNYHIYNNLLLSGGIKLREGFFRIVENNIIINNSLHPHVWHENSDDVFTKNVVTTGYYPIRMPKIWTKYIDKNIFLDSLSCEKSKVDGRDSISIYCPPDFINAEAGDYRFKENSPAFSVGFKNFDMNNFGVVSENLKALAKKPPLPKLISFVYKENEVVTINDMEVKSVKMGERSATGMFAEKGVFVVNVNEKSKFSDILKSGDVILSYNTKEINNLRDFQEAVMTPNWSASIKIGVYRRGRGMLNLILTK